MSDGDAERFVSYLNYSAEPPCLVLSNVQSMKNIEELSESARNELDQNCSGIVEQDQNGPVQNKPNRNNHVESEQVENEKVDD